MLMLLNKRLRSDERGFTLIELMVVVLIIAILIAIAIPTFLGARKRAQRRQAQSALRNTLTTEKTYYTDNQTYTESSTVLEAEEPNLNYAATSDAVNEVGVDVTTTDFQEVSMAAWSKSQDCYYIYEAAVTGTTYGKTEGTGVTSCTPPTTLGGVPNQGPW